jgi:hypothetical protein
MGRQKVLNCTVAIWICLIEIIVITTGAKLKFVTEGMNNLIWPQ